MLRRLADFNAFIEGWGLYSERLADEMGLYSDDVARLGMLAADSMRACRLVVDTGLHAKGWTRDQVVSYMRANSVMPMIEIEPGDGQYIADPAQALAYMVGGWRSSGSGPTRSGRLGDGSTCARSTTWCWARDRCRSACSDEVIRGWAATAADARITRRGGLYGHSSELVQSSCPIPPVRMVFLESVDGSIRPRRP
jgi:hypothetical protein